MEVKAESKRVRFRIDMDIDEYEEFVKAVNKLFEQTVNGKNINPLPSHVVEPIVTLKNVMAAALLE